MSTIALVNTHRSAVADNGEVPFDLQAKLFLTALTYDKNLEKRAGSLLNIGIVYFTDAKEAENFSNTLKEFKDKKISGRSFKAVLLAYNGNGDLKKKLVEEEIDVVFISRGEKQQVEKLLKLTQSEKILSCTSKAEYVTTCGVTMAVGLKDNKPKIYLNLSSAGQISVQNFFVLLKLWMKKAGRDRAIKTSQAGYWGLTVYV
jgi:hypothetical protein